jgi:hypothetical protein
MGPTMNPQAIGSPALVVYAFAALDGGADTTQRGWARLEELWTACRAVGPCTEPLLGVTAPEQLPEAPTSDEPFRVIASASRAAPGPVRSVFVFAEYGTAGLVAALSADGDGITGSRELINQWQAATPPATTSLLGQVTVLLGFAPSLATRSDVGHIGFELARQLGADDPSPEADTGPGDSLLWELRPDSGHKVLVVAAPDSAEDDVERWIWATDGYQGLMSLTRYCLNVARAEHQRHVFQSLRPVSDLIAEVDAATKTLVIQLDSPGPADADAQRLLVADNALQRLQVSESGVLWRMTRIQEMAATVRALHANIHRHRPSGSAPATPGGMAARDDAMMTWLTAQLDREAGYLDGLSRRVTAAHATVSSMVQSVISRRRERITLLQTSFLGALLMALAAIQAFQYSVRINHAVIAPLTCVLAAAAFGLPLLVVRWSGLLPRTEPYRWPDLLAATVLGAAVGWLASSSCWLAVTHRVAPWWATVPAVVAPGLLCALVTLRITVSTAGSMRVLARFPFAP